MATCDGYQSYKQNNWCKDTITSVQWDYSFREFERFFHNAACASCSMTECAPAYRFASTSERELRKAYGIATIIVQLSRIFHVTNNVANGIFDYFQLQLGMKLLPVWVNWCWSVPSDSIDQISVCLPISRWKTMWRVSGAQLG